MFAAWLFLAFFGLALAGVPLLYALLGTTVGAIIVAGLSHPMGPLRLSDLIGLDTMKLIADSMYDEYKDANFAPPPLLLRMVEAGQLGKKSGKGFYTY